MPDTELAALMINIEEHGLREPGVLFEGMVLDGWHRYIACQKLDIPFKTKEFDGDDPGAFALSVNLHRRHLTPSQRAAAVVKCNEWRLNGVRNQTVASSPATLQGCISDTMAKQVNVSPRTIVEAKRAQEIGLGDEVRDGKVSAHAAAKVAKLPKEKRERAVKAIKEGKTPRVPKEKTNRSDDDKKARTALIDLQGKYADLLEKHNDLADTAKELEDKLSAFEASEPDEQQKLIGELQLKLRKKDAEIDRLRVQIRDANNKNNELIRTVKRLQKNAR